MPAGRFQWFLNKDFSRIFHASLLTQIEMFIAKMALKKDQRQTSNSNSLFMHSTDMHSDYAAELTP